MGVDTHARNHIYAVLDASNGPLLETRDFPTSGPGVTRANAWVARRTEANSDTCWVIEGAVSNGAILTGAVASDGFPVLEVPWMAKENIRGIGKTDSLDAHRIVMATLPLEVEQMCRPHLDEGIR